MGYWYSGELKGVCDTGIKKCLESYPTLRIGKVRRIDDGDPSLNDVAND